MNIYYSSQFNKDYKKIKKQDKDVDKLKIVVDLLVSGIKMGPQYQDHQLAGRWKGHRDCHIEPDWILIYRKTSDSLVLERMGTHSDLFK